MPLRHVPYRGTPTALPDLMSGRIATYIASSAEFVEHARSGAINILATADPVRTSFLPHVPTLQESGVDVEAPAWFGLYAPAGTAPVVLQRVESLTVAAVRAPEINARLLALGFQPSGSTADELKVIQRAQFVRWRSLVKRLDYKLE